jgi:hypothetical protein
MPRIILGLVCLFISAGSVPALAGMPGGGSGDCNMAWVNARAGGPTNSYGAWLLETCGCEPGSTNWYCERLARGEKGWPPRANRNVLHPAPRL